jgi:hypothetical protein
VIWRAYSVTEGDHRQVAVATSLKGRHPTLSDLTAQGIEPLDVSDDRWSHLLQHVRKPASWHPIARDFNARRMEVPAWPQDVLHCDAPTVAGDHEVPEGGLGPCGQRQEDPTRPPLTVRMGALAPLGMPLATEVVAGARAEEGFHLPIMERLRPGLTTPGLLLVGDCTRRALETRASLARPQDFSGSPLPLTGATAEAMDAWITAGVTPGERGEFTRRGRPHARGHKVLAAEGSEWERTCDTPGDAVDAAAWPARVLVGRSPRHAAHQAAGLAKRLGHAEPKLAALTPPRGRGKRPITDEATRVEAIDVVRTEPRGDGWLRVTWAQQVEQTTHSGGRGRGAGHREKRVRQQTRSPLTPSARQADTMAGLSQRFGWQACVPNARPPRRSVEEAV